MADAEASTPTGGTPVRHRKITCSSCRRRKSKCDGGQPSCSTCIAYKVKCQYDKAPSIAYVRSLQDRIQKLEEQLKHARLGHDEDASTPAKDSVTTPSATAEDETSISVDEHGAVCYHNPTSAIHEAPLQKLQSVSPLSSTEPDASATERQNAEIRRSLVANAATQRQWEDIGLEMVSARTDIPKDLASALLQLHWCWIHPMFMFLYRPAFTRDMSLLTSQNQYMPYCSNTLLKVVYAHSCRFIREPITFWSQKYQRYPESPQSPSQLLDRLTQEAQESLAMETLNPPSIPTIQALLQQSAREVAFGRSSQAWLYSGMAFRMAIDLGVHLPTDKLQSYVKSLSPEDIEIRKRLFWSLYAWDKAISLYLGRMPNFLTGADNIPLDFLDDFAELDLWQPYYGPTSSDADNPHHPPYPPVTGHVISCFSELCKLYKIISTLMLEMYSTQPASHTKIKGLNSDPKAASFVAINAELHAWWSALPDFLRIIPGNLPGLCPPPHILNLNLLYHATLILLHRPYIIGQRDFANAAVQRSFTICRTATTAIHDLLKLHTSTFGFSHITYMNSYCTYTAATVAVFQLEHQQHAHAGPPGGAHAQAELRFLLEIMQRTAAAMPGLTRSIHIIKAKIKNIFDRHVSSQLDSLFVVRPPHQQTPYNPGTSASPSASSPFSLPPAPLQQHQQSYAPVPSAPSQTAPFASWAESLPAFPGQQEVFVSSEPAPEGEEMSPDARFALLGSSLDPHLSLDHGDAIDFATADFFRGFG